MLEAAREEDKVVGGESDSNLKYLLVQGTDQGFCSFTCRWVSSKTILEDGVKWGTYNFSLPEMVQHKNPTDTILLHKKNP